MKKYIPIYVYGTIIILSGVILLFSDISNFNGIKYTLGITLTLGAIFAFLAALSRQRKQVQFAYHEMHALTMLVYGISVLAFCNTFDMLVSLTSFLFIFYAFSEIIFCTWLFNLNGKASYKIILVRLLVGLAIGMGTVVGMTLTAYTLEIFGVLFMMVGINIILYVPVMKRDQIDEKLDQLNAQEGETLV
jgi:uncharacterized membrane protein HdeD (DUF308 family)